MIENDKGRKHLEQLINKGVQIPCPESVEVGSDISPDRISGENVIIHSGSKILGKDTLIMSGTQLGYEAPVTVNNCQLGRNVKLQGGFYDRAVFLHGASMGSSAHIREASLLEEGAKGAHTVGLKQTILFPFVTLGSLINFCDCLMSGGTNKKNHSEVGSSYIHFNYTPNQDKATASLIGDVPRGVMMNQPPIFLGGQGGLTGPLRVEYGNIVAAGTIIRKDILRNNLIVLGEKIPLKSIPFHAGLYTNAKRLIELNTNYISNLIALRRWYFDVRQNIMCSDNMEQELHRGAVDKLDIAIKERLKRLGEVAGNIPRSIEIYKEMMGEKALESVILRKNEFFNAWPQMERVFKESCNGKGDHSKRDQFLKYVENSIERNGKDYIRVIKGLDKTESDLGISWLKGFVEETNSKVWDLLPMFGIKSVMSG